MSLANNDYYNNTSQDIYDEEFVSLINGLNDSIKEYYKVSKHNIKQTNDFLIRVENQTKSIENGINEIMQNITLDKNNEISQAINQSQNMVNQLQNNSLSNEKNLNLFFEDAKILFKKMRAKRNENLINLRRTIRSHSGKNNMNLNLNFTLRDNNKKRKILYYLNQLKDYNEIVGKFSVKAKYNFINLQKMISGILNDNQNNNSNNISVVNRENYSNNNDSNY